jgi:asparagine synthase (glutamine-hydrolysing)
VCGIACIAAPHDQTLLELLGRALAHRGPDGAGTYSDPTGAVGLASCRLAILDQPGGAQPMASDDGSIRIVFNGEIFNAPELRADLERGGRRFRSDHSDTEVLLRLYEERGEGMLAALNGMFAFIIYDQRRNLLFGARDPFGIKPLYHAPITGGHAFASELRTLLELPGVQRELDAASLSHYLSLRFVPGRTSIFRGIQRLPAGHLFRLRLDGGPVEVERWWKLQFEPDHGLSRGEWIERLRSELLAAVHRWCLSDVTVACSLSGGLDSSAVLALMAEGGVRDIHSYTLGFASAGDGQLDELPLARLQAERWGSAHHELVVDADSLLNDLLSMVWALDEPYGGGLPSWYVFRFMASEVKVALTGTGGDELFGNYRRFVPFETGRLAPLRRILGSGFRRYYFEPSYYFTDGEKRALLQQSSDAVSTSRLLQHVYEESGSSSSRDSVLYLDTSTQLVDEFLLMTDRFSMAHSLEARVPFLDRKLVELVASIPALLRTSSDDPKGLLREAVADLLTPAHLEAPKRGFVFPLARWLRQELRPLAELLLADDYLRRQGIFRPGLRRRYLEPHLNGARDESERLWPLLMFQLWHLLYVEEALCGPPTFTWRDVVGMPVRSRRSGAGH